MSLESSRIHGWILLGDGCLEIVNVWLNLGDGWDLS